MGTYVFIPARISVMLVDDHKMFRDLWSMILSRDERFHVCAEAEDGAEAVEIAKQTRPNIILMDINMKMDGFEATRLIRKYSPGSKIIGMSMYVLPAYSKKLLSLGAKGYVTKNSSAEEVFTAIIQVNSGESYVCSHIQQMLDKSLPQDDELSGSMSLSKREVEVIGLIKEGLTSKAIADRLNLSLSTIEIHRHNIFRKLKIKNVAALLNFSHINSL